MSVDQPNLWNVAVHMLATMLLVTTPRGFAYPSGVA
jgi:hypothetical protein